MRGNRGRLCSCEPSARQRNQQGIGCLQEIVLEAMRFKHDHHLQILGAVMGRLGHAALLDPANKNLRATVPTGEARLEADLLDRCEGHYAGSLWCTPSLAVLAT
jgi:hypothetical protein